MKVGVDASPLRRQLTGVGHYIHRLLEPLIKMRPNDTFFLYSIENSGVLSTYAKYPNVVIRSHNFLGFSEALWSQTTLPYLCKKNQLDVFWGTTQSIPLFLKCRSVITIYDFVYRLFPKTTTLVRGLYLRLFGQFFYQKADQCMVISSGTGIRLKELYNLEPDAVILPPVQVKIDYKDDVLSRYDLEHKNYYIVVGTLEPRKNLKALIENYELSTPLVFVGMKGWGKEEIKKLNTDIRILGYVSDAELYSLIGNAKALLMPSLYEGYGMPLAEARVLGTPVACSNVPEMLEAAENDAVVLDFDHLSLQLCQVFSPPLTPGYLTTEELACKLMHALYLS